MKKIIFGLCLLILSTSSFAIHRDAMNCEVYVYGISIKETLFRDGSNNQFTGKKKVITLDLGIDKRKIDSDIKRVGFQGMREESMNGHVSSYPYSANFVQDKEGRVGIWTSSIDLDVNIQGLMQFKYGGAFFVETELGTYYWLKSPTGSIFSLDGETSPSLSSFNSNCN